MYFSYWIQIWQWESEFQKPILKSEICVPVICRELKPILSIKSYFALTTYIDKFATLDLSQISRLLIQSTISHVQG